MIIINNKIFTLLFILSIFVGAIHESSHTHLDEDLCEVCIVAHTPALLQEAPSLLSIYISFEAFEDRFIVLPKSATLTLRSRSPPIS